MDNNDLNVFTYGYGGYNIKYIPNWPKIISQFFRNIKYAYQRAVKGYCDQDIWNLDTFLTCLMRDSIFRLADTSYGYPGDDTEEGSSFENWTNYLNEIALLLDKSIDRTFEENQYYINEFEKEYSKYLETRAFETEELPDGCFRLIDNSTKEEKELTNKYFKEEKRIHKLRVKDRNKALDMIKKRFESLWY